MKHAYRAAVWVGGGALLAATLIDTVAVIGRNLGLPVVGSIELVQGAVLLSGILGIVLATSGDDHAHVRLLADRSPRARQLADRVGALAMIALFAALLIGSAWLAVDLWDGHERSELLHVPWRVLRLVANLGLAACIAIALVRLIRGSRP